MNSLISFVRNIRMCVINVAEALQSRTFSYPELALAGGLHPLNIPSEKEKSKSSSSLEDIIGNGFLWAVPKQRRSLERRMTRRMGLGKMILPKNNLIVCDACGHFHPVHTICGNCYEKVKAETEIMQEAVMKELKLDPIEQEIVILYENDTKATRTFEGKRIVELPKERPKWFCQNLLEKDSDFPRKRTTSLRDTTITPKIETV